ncbi:MAG: hypothetical protein AAF065_09680, partial [Verrucomicrobiota bacterium]
KIEFWAWPNILAFDAALIAVGWQWVFAISNNEGPNLASSAVLCLSVWLTYIADRLFDVARRPSRDLLSHRHRFAKQNQGILWTVWMVILVANLTIAFPGLSSKQLFNGFILLSLCLTYTGLNHALSKHFFPKELLVAIIFAGGTQVFLSKPVGKLSIFAFGLLCFMNCIIIAKKEKAVDAGLNVRSISSVLDTRLLNILLAVGILCALFSSDPVALLPTAFCLTLLQLYRRHFATERFRVLCDTSLLITPGLYLLFGSGGVFVR